jgi:hypothetical protein
LINRNEKRFEIEDENCDAFKAAFTLDRTGYDRVQDYQEAEVAFTHID